MNEAVDLGAQLPGLLRGAYYEQWRPAITPVKNRHVEDFLARVNESFGRDPLTEPAKAVMAVFQLLTKKISEGEIDDVRRCLPEEIRNIWPEPYKEPERSATDGTAHCEFENSKDLQLSNPRSPSHFGIRAGIRHGRLDQSFRSASPQRFNMAFRTESRSLSTEAKSLAGRLNRSPNSTLTAVFRGSH